MVVPRLPSQSAFVRGFIDDAALFVIIIVGGLVSQSAFVRGFIDDVPPLLIVTKPGTPCLNPRSCAASSMTARLASSDALTALSQSAFVRGFIDDE